MTEIVKAAVAPSLPDMVRYAERLADANLLPGQYRKQPANVLYAMEYGRTLGITPVAAITGIHVIEGKPSASAALISGLVRQAGHKLRVKGNAHSATAQIIRVDDPDFVYEVTWELTRNPSGNPNAEDAGLLKKDIWKKYPASMLKSRAISQVARDACEEVLYGLHYTPEELGANVDADGEPVAAEVQQLRRVQPGERDSWADSTPPQNTVIKGRSQPAQDIADVAGTTNDQEVVKDLYRQANADGLLAETVRVDRELLELGAYLIARGKQLAEPAPSGKALSDDGVVDAEVVESAASPQDVITVAAADDGYRAPSFDTEAEVAEGDLRAAAANAGLDNLDAEFERSYGLPIAQAGVRQMREMTALLTGPAA